MSSKWVVFALPPFVRTRETACSAWRSARCAPVAPRFGPDTATESWSSSASLETRRRSRSPSLRASTSSSTSNTAATTSDRVRTTFASAGAAAVTAVRRCPLAMRLENAIARYLVSLISFLPENQKAPHLGGLQWIAERVCELAAASQNVVAHRTDARAMGLGHGHGAAAICHLRPN